MQHARRNRKRVVSTAEIEPSWWRPAPALVAAVFLALAWNGSPPSVADEIPDEDSRPASVDALAGEQLDLGRRVFHRKCAKCHISGREGAPVVGQPGEWTRRLRQPVGVLVQHAINGHEGRGGRMPPKGNFATLSDEEVTAAVQYIVARGEWLAHRMKSSRIACKKSSPEAQCLPADASDGLLLRMLWLLSESR